MNLLFNRRAHVFWEQVSMFELFPFPKSALRSLDRDLPERACRDSCRVGKMPHLIFRDVGKAAAAAEAQGEIILRKVRQRCHKIIGR